MGPIRFIMIGGFLGAGKTTAIARLARHFIDQGNNVGLITNDQAYDLVDTRSLQAQGFHVGEVPGACFCCKFENLVETAKQLREQHHPDIIISEPVGSCTDLVATVIEPLSHLHGDQYQVAPLVVLLKPEHGRKILQAGKSVGFSAKAAYIFLKQIEEADVVAINKIDKLVPAQRDELLDLVRKRFPGKPVFAVSARCGDGFQSLIDAVQRNAVGHHALAAVDYDIYAEGEAELGWLNCTVQLTSGEGRHIELDTLVVGFVDRMREQLGRQQAEPAHLKVLGQDRQGNAAMANLVASDVDVELSKASNCQSPAVELTVNARVATSPEQLEQVVRAAVDSVARRFQLSSAIDDVQRFRPGRPVPTHWPTRPRE